MRKLAGIVTSLSLGLAMAAGAPAFAQSAPAAAPTINLAPGTTVYDSAGKAIGPIASVADPNVVITVDGKSVALPKTSFMETDKGPAITLTLEQLTAWLDQQAAAATAALNAALVPGANIRSAKGTAIVGKVKVVEADAVVLTTAEGDMRLPKSAFFQSQQGLATSFTAEQFAAAIAEAKAAAQPAATAEAAADPAPAEATAKEAN
jgi:hypothetical protein